MNNKKEIKVTCDDIDYQLNGVARYNDKVIFIEGILPGEEAIVEVFKETKKFSFAKVKTIISESDVRVNPICENYFDCGGCDLMHIEYVEQLRMKKQMVQNELLRNKLSHIKLCDPIGMEYPFEYRNKVSVPIREVNGNVSCGFYKKKSHEIVEFGKCYVQPNTSNDIVTFVRNYISDNKLSCYNEKLGKGGLRHIIIRSSVDGKYMVTLVVNERFDLEIDSLASALVKQFECMETIVLNVNTKKSNVILGDEEVILHGDGYILDRYDNKVFKVGSKSFFQINSTQAVKLYDKASELFGVDKKKVLIDLYCGVGSISLYMSDNYEKIVGVEVVESAVKNAIENAKLNNVINHDFIIGKSENALSDILGTYVDYQLVVDPPRKGCDENLINTLVKSEIKELVYISCNHNTLIRDVLLFEQFGYKVSKMELVDMFPHTKHIECVCLISKVS